MIDTGTGLTILGSAVGGAKVLEKILGPTSDYIGDQIKEWAKKKVDNTSKIFKNAEKKLGNKINNPGKVPPKVLKEILEEGSWCEEELQIDYLGGVLASSRSEISRDDRGAYFASLISRLTTYQLRTHYIFYRAVKLHFDSSDVQIAERAVREKLKIFIPMETYLAGMDFNFEESKNRNSLIAHSIWGMNKEDLINNDFIYGPSEFVRKQSPEISVAGIIFTPTILGVELFLWAFGKGDLNYQFFFNPDFEIEEFNSIPTGPTHKINAL